MQKKHLTMYVFVGALLVVLVGLAVLLFGTTPNANATVSGDTTNFIQSSVAPGAMVTGSVIWNGSVQGSYFFEASAEGSVLDANKKVLATFPITATSHWMTAGPVGFTSFVETTLLPKGPGYFRITRANPSADPSLEKFIDVPVVLK